MDLRGGDVMVADSGRVSALALSPGETMLAVARDYAVELCDAATTRPLRVLAGHTGWVRAVAFSPSGDRLVTAAGDHTVRIWDVLTGTATLSVRVDYPGAVCFFPDGDRVAVGAAEGELMVVDAAGRTTTFASGRRAASLTFSADGTLLAVVEDGGRCRVYEVATGHVRLDLSASWRMPRQLVGVAFTPDGSAITLVDRSGAIRVRNLAGGRSRTVAEAVPKPRRPIEDVVFPGGGTRVIASPHQILRSLDLRDAATGAVTGTLEGVDGLVTALAAGERRMVVGTSEGRLHVWDRPGDEPVVTGRLYDPVWDLRLSPDGRLLATQDNNGDVHLWEIATGRLRERFAGDLYHRVGVAFTPDGTGLAVADLKSPPQVRDLTGGRVRLTLDHPPDTTSEMLFSPDGRRLITVDRDHHVRVWNAATGTLDHQLEARPDRAVCSPDGDTIALITTWQITLWHLPSDRRSTLFGASSESSPKVSSALAFSPAGRLTAAAANRTEVWIWPGGAVGARRVLSIGLSESVQFLAFSPDGTRLAVSPFKGAPRVLDVATGAVLAEMAGHYDRVPALAFGPDGTTLVTASLDGTARLWDAASGAPITTFVPLPDGDGVAILPGGRVVGRGAERRLWRAGEVGLESAAGE